MLASRKQDCLLYQSDNAKKNGEQKLFFNVLHTLHEKLSERFSVGLI